MAKKRLLVIDDELGPRESLRFLFKDRYDVVCVDSVDQGVAEVKRHPPDCVISDIKMPGKNGIEGLKEIRQIDPHVSIIMLTGFGSLATAQEAIRHGATDYIKKPFDASEIREVVARTMQRTRYHRMRAQAAAHLEALNIQLQEQLSDKEKWASLGEKSSEFVHDLSNPISVIGGYVHMLLDELRSKGAELGDQNVNYLEQIEKSVVRCREMLMLWRDRAVREGSSVQRVSIGDVVREVAQNASALATKRNILIRVQDEGLSGCTVEGNNTQLFRAVQNLVVNSMEALRPQGGTIEIGGGRRDGWVRIEVGDDGEGFPPGKIDELQVRYYTTRRDAGGMGLGLFITKNIAEAHGGSLILANRPDGRGAMVTLVLPEKN